MQPRPTRLTLAAVIAATVAPTLMNHDASAQNLSDRIREVARQRDAASARDTSQAALLGSLLYSDLSVDFDETPARDAFEYIKQLMGVDLVVRYSDDRSGIGIDPETPITLKATGQARPHRRRDDARPVRRLSTPAPGSSAEGLHRDRHQGTALPSFGS